MLLALMFQTIVATGQLEPQAAYRAKGTLTITREAQADVLRFAEDYSMNSGVVLELTVCGELDPGMDVCLSQGEVRKLRGPYEMALRHRFHRYKKIRIVDLDLVQDHATATLQ